MIVPDDVGQTRLSLHHRRNQRRSGASEAAKGFARLAVESRSVVAQLNDVPNQPLRFADRPDDALVEDAIIAHQQMKFIKGRDPEQLRAPAHGEERRGGDDRDPAVPGQRCGRKSAGDGFVVAGGSKRGWTTWLVGALDPRVRAIIPIVINSLDGDATTRHHWGAMGYFSPAIKDYVDHGLIPGMIGHPGLDEIRRIEDPLSYSDRPSMTHAEVHHQCGRR